MAALENILLDHQRTIKDSIAKAETGLSARHRKLMLLRSKRDEIRDALRTARRASHAEAGFDEIARILCENGRRLDHGVARVQGQVLSLNSEVEGLGYHLADVRFVLGCLADRNRREESPPDVWHCV